MSQAVGRRMLWLALGRVVGLVCGAVLTLPLGWWLASLIPGGRPYPVWLTCLVGGAVGAILGEITAQSLTAHRSEWRAIVTSGLQWAACGYLIGFAIAAPLWWLSGGLFPAAALLIYFTWVSAQTGLLRAMDRATQDEKKFQKEVCQRAWDLQVQQAALEAEIERRFGPLDEARRARIRTWDTGRVTAARQKLEETSRVEELDD